MYVIYNKGRKDGFGPSSMAQNIMDQMAKQGENSTCATALGPVAKFQCSAGLGEPWPAGGGAKSGIWQTKS